MRLYQPGVLSETSSVLHFPSILNFSCSRVMRLNQPGVLSETSSVPHFSCPPAPLYWLKPVAQLRNPGRVAWSLAAYMDFGRVGAWVSRYSSNTYRRLDDSVYSSAWPTGSPESSMMVTYRGSFPRVAIVHASNLYEARLRQPQERLQTCPPPGYYCSNLQNCVLYRANHFETNVSNKKIKVLKNKLNICIVIRFSESMILTDSVKISLSPRRS